jgi:hypothetical protein
MTEWEINIRRGLSIGVGLIIFIFLADAGLIWLAVTRPLGLGTFIIGLTVLLGSGMLGLIAYWVYSLAHSGYSLDRNTLTIRWGPAEQMIPTAQIERVFTGVELEGPTQFQGGAWPGHWVGYGTVPGAGQALFYATVPPQEQIYIATPGLVYGISPANHEKFLESLQTRLQMGPTQITEQSSKRPAILDWPIWQERLSLLLLSGGILMLLALVGWVCLQFPKLPLLIPLHFDAMGTPDRLGPRSHIFIIPLIGLLALLLNGVLGSLAHGREKVASQLLWSGAILIQILVWVAAIGILGQI